MMFRDELADCVFTSPPYAVGLQYGSYEDTIENLRIMLPKLSRRWNECVLSGGFAVVNFADVILKNAVEKTEEPCEYPMALEYWPCFRADGWVLWSRRIWCKRGGSSTHSIYSNRAAANWEHVWTWKRPGDAIISNQVTGQYSSRLGWFDTVHETKNEIDKSTHCAVMPVKTTAHCIAIHSHEGSIVHEPFCGSGTTLIAAEQLGRKCFAIEIEPRYCDVIIERWQNLTGKKAVRET